MERLHSQDIKGERMKELETKLKEIKSIVDDLLKEIEKPLLTKKQRWHLQQDLDYFRKATGHEYIKVVYLKTTFQNWWNCVRFYYISERTGQERYDMLSGNPCYTEKMTIYKQYSLEELGVK